MHGNGDRGAAIVWRPLVVCLQAEIARQLGSALQELGIAEACHVGEYPRTGTIAPMAAKHECNICFLDVASREERALELIPEAAAAMPVVALHSRDDADLILRCLRLGACEFLSHPVAEPVRTLFERLAKGRAKARGGGCAGALYCVVPGKPGCGASTVAAHLAIQMGAGGGARVLLVDADPLTGSIEFMLKVKSEFHFGDALMDWKRMDKDLWRRLTAPCSGIDVLLAPENPWTRIEVGRQLAGELASFWRERYDAVVVDTPDVRAAEAGFVAVADLTLVVTTNELAALHSTRRAIDYLEQSFHDRARIRLIVNRYVAATGIRREDMKTALQMEPFAMLDNDYEGMQTALLEGKPAPPDSRFGTGIQALLRQLRGEPESEKKAAFSFGLFRHRGK